jgi:hypothetical protein
MKSAAGLAFGVALAVLTNMAATGGCGRCPQLPEPPRTATFRIVEAVDPAAVGGLVRVAEADLGYRDFIVTYESEVGAVEVLYRWP